MYAPLLPAELLVLDQLLYSFAGGSIAEQNLNQPFWYLPAYHVAWVLGLCFLLYVVPALGTTAAILASTLVVSALLALQVGVQIRLQIWLPLGTLIQYLLAFSPLVLWWAQRRRLWQHIITERDEALMALARLSLQEGQLEKAFERLQRCEASPALTELGYELAVEQEQRRSYQAAGNTYRWLVEFAPKYRDVASKAETMVASYRPSAPDAFAATQTLSIPAEQLRKPVMGRYQIEHELGRGAMGVVYLGIDNKISRRVAIKTLSHQLFADAELTDLKKRFFREAEAAGRLAHPNIVTIYDVGEEPDLSFIAMDYIEGDSLARHSTKDALLAVETVYELIAQVAEAIDYAHHQNIVHRDIKPSNLLYNTQNNQVKVADFGIARITDNACTKTGDILGSPIYMSPEQLKGSKVTGATDIYSLGVTFYQLLTGSVPYSGDSIANLAYQIVNKKFKSARDLRPELPGSAVRIVNKAMAKDPEKRFQDAGAMALSLRKAMRKDFGIAS